jgi:hypothetical protein
MRDYQKIAVVIWHDEALEPGAPRYGAYFDGFEEAKSYFDLIQQFTPTAKTDLMDFRWIGWNDKAIIQTLNSAYAAFFNYQLFIDGYDGFAYESTEGRGIVIGVESLRRSGFNSLSERPKSRRRR